MNRFARFSSADRAALFSQAASQTGLPVALIEKDFWVCWMLGQLWSLPRAAPHLIFKGGTSLSKCFGLIQRFSEDIDIGVDPALLGFDQSNDPEADGLSGNEHKRRLGALKARAKEWIEGELLPILRAAISTELGNEGANNWSFEVFLDRDGMPKLRFSPPSSTPRGRRGAVTPYVRESVLLEVGARSAHWPAGFHEVTPYVAEQIPAAFEAPTTSICTLEPARTFWEKATILHVLFHKTNTDINAGKLPKERERLSRHCSDLRSIAQSVEGETIIKNTELLADVVTYTRKLWCESNAEKAFYDDARPGTLRLAPHPALDDFFADDYAKMQSSGMFFGDVPSWPEIRQTLYDLEEQINSLP